MQDIQSLIRQARDENWEELDLSGMGLTELPMADGAGRRPSNSTR